VFSGFVVKMAFSLFPAAEFDLLSDLSLTFKGSLIISELVFFFLAYFQMDNLCFMFIFPKESQFS